MLLSSGFVGLGEAFAEKTSELFKTVQGVQTFNPRPVSPSGYSFNFAEAAQKLLQPFRSATDPKAAAGSSVILSAGDAASGIIRAAADRIQDVLRNSGKKEETPQLVTNPNNSLPSQVTSNLSDILSFLSGGRPADPAVAVGTSQITQLAADAAKNTQQNVLLIGAAFLGLAFITLAKGR